MEHIAYCESKAKELDNLLAGNKNMLIRGATGRKLPHGRVALGETVYLLENDGSGIIKAKGIVSDVFHSEALTPDQRIPELMDLYEIPGSSLALAQGGRLVWTAAYGYSNPEREERLTPDTPMRVQSISKSLTAWDGPFHLRPKRRSDGSDSYRVYHQGKTGCPPTSIRKRLPAV